MPSVSKFLSRQPDINGVVVLAVAVVSTALIAYGMGYQSGYADHRSRYFNSTTDASDSNSALDRIVRHEIADLVAEDHKKQFEARGMDGYDAATKISFRFLDRYDEGVICAEKGGGTVLFYIIDGREGLSYVPLDHADSYLVREMKHLCGRTNEMRS